MADADNSGQFGNRDDTEEQASKGGQASSGSFGSEKATDPREAGPTMPRLKAARTATRTTAPPPTSSQRHV